MNFRDRIFHSAFYRIIGRVFTVAIALVVTPFLMRHLGEQGYGLWLLIMAAVGWARFIDFGFSAAVQRSIAIALENNDQHRINTVFSCSVLLYAVLGSVAAFAIVLLGLFPGLLGVSGDFSSVVTVSLLILSLKVLLDLAMCCFHGFFSGLLRYDIDANINTANEVLKALGVLLLVPEYFILGAVIATIVSDLITNVYKVYYVKKIYPDFLFDKSLIEKDEFIELFNYSKHVILLTIATTFHRNIDLLVISHVIGLTAVAVFGVGKRLVVMVEELFLTVLGMFLPVFTRLMERKDDIRVEVEQVFMLNNFLVVICFAPLIMFSDHFILLWLGEGFEESRVIVTGLAFALMCRCVARPVETLLLAKARHSSLSFIKIFQLFVLVLLSIILGPELGLVGIIYASLISFYVSDVILMSLLYVKHIGYPVMNLLLRFLFANVVLAVFSQIGTGLVNSVSPLNWLELFFLAGLAFLLVTLICWFLLIDSRLRGQILETIESNLRRSKLVQ